MITLAQIAKAQQEYMAKHHKVPTRIIMNPVAANELNTYLREKALYEEIKTREIFLEVEARWPKEVADGEARVRGLLIRFAAHYPVDYFEVTD